MFLAGVVSMQGVGQDGLKSPCLQSGIAVRGAGQRAVDERLATERARSGVALGAHQPGLY